MKKIQSLIGVLCVLTLCICMSGCNQTEKNEDKIGVGNPEEELAVSPYTSGETDEGITNLSDINEMSSFRSRSMNIVLPSR